MGESINSAGLGEATLGQATLGEAGRGEATQGKHQGEDPRVFSLVLHNGAA